MNKSAPCYKKKFGHNFAAAGGNCARCGVNQEELSRQFEKIKKYKIKDPEKGMHSAIHALAKDVSEYCGEPKKFAMYLGIIKNIGIRKAYRLFSEMKQSRNIATPGKLFVFKSKYKK